MVSRAAGLSRPLTFVAVLSSTIVPPLLMLEVESAVPALLKKTVPAAETP